MVRRGWYRAGHGLPPFYIMYLTDSGKDPVTNASAPVFRNSNEFLHLGVGMGFQLKKIDQMGALFRLD